MIFGYEIMNDVYLIPYYIKIALLLFSTLAISLFIHELGHVFWFVVNKHKMIKLRYKSFVCYAGEEKDYENLTEKEYLNVNIWGFITGTLPIIYAGCLFFPSIFLIIPYIAATWQDSKVILDKLTEDLVE